MDDVNVAAGRCDQSDGSALLRGAGLGLSGCGWGLLLSAARLRSGSRLSFRLGADGGDPDGRSRGGSLHRGELCERVVPSG